MRRSRKSSARRWIGRRAGNPDAGGIPPSVGGSAWEKLGPELARPRFARRASVSARQTRKSSRTSRATSGANATAANSTDPDEVPRRAPPAIRLMRARDSLKDRVILRPDDRAHGESSPSCQGYTPFTPRSEFRSWSPTRSLGGSAYEFTCWPNRQGRDLCVLRRRQLARSRDGIAMPRRSTCGIGDG